MSATAINLQSEAHRVDTTHWAIFTSSGGTTFRYVFFIAVTLILASCNPKIGGGLRKNDLNKDVKMVTTHGTMTIRLYNSAPLHRANFLKLVKQGFYNQLLFHRVISGFMIQAGDPLSRRADSGQKIGGGGPGYTINAEIRPELFHKKGAVAAARQGNDVNPEKKSSGSQFYIVQGKAFTDSGLDSVETIAQSGKKLPPAHREVYKSIGGSPHLDLNYTVFGQVVEGLEVIDKIAVEQTRGPAEGNRPVKDVRIVKAFLVKRKSHLNITN